MPSITPDIIVGLARENDDFGFEMRVGRILRDFPGMEVRHGDTYIDHRTGTERQFDYQCIIKNEHLRIQLAIECKNVFIDSPVVVCGHRRVAAEAFHELIFSGRGYLNGRPGREFMEGNVFDNVRVGPESGMYPAYHSGECFVGKSVLLPKPPQKEHTNSSKKDQRPWSGYTVQPDKEVYDRWNQALGSGADLALKSLKFDNVQVKDFRFVCTFSIPVVVIPDGALWQLEFDDAGDPISPPKQIDHTTLFRGHRVNTLEAGGIGYWICLSHVHFVTVTGLRKWLNIINDAHSTDWLMAFRPAAIDEFKTRFFVPHEYA